MALNLSNKFLKTHKNHVCYFLLHHNKANRYHHIIVKSQIIKNLNKTLICIK